MAKADTIAYGIWKLIYLILTYKVVTWHSVHVSLIWYSSHSFSFFFIASFIASLPLLIPLPHSLPMYLSQTTTISLYPSLSLAQSPFYSPYRYYFVIGSPYLPLSISLAFSLFGATSYHTSLYLCDIVPLLPPLLLSNLSVFFTLSPCLISWQTLNLFLFLPVSFPPYRSFSLTHTYNSLSLFLSHSYFLPLDLSLTLSLTLSISISLSISLSFSLSYLCLSFALSSLSSLLSLTVSHSLSISFSLSLSFSLSISLSYSFSLSQSHSLFLSLSLSFSLS